MILHGRKGRKHRADSVRVFWKGKNKKSVHDGVKASYAHMSPARDDASQGAFFEISEILKNQYFLHYKKSGKNLGKF